jgi:hypothetical protein
MPSISFEYLQNLQLLLACYGKHQSPSPLHISDGMTSHTLIRLVAFARNFKLLHLQ